MQGVVYKIVDKITQKAYAAKFYHTRDEEEISMV